MNEYKNMDCRSLDLQVAIQVLGWTQCIPTGKDFDGVQYPDIYGPTPLYAKGITFPPRGEIPAGWLAPSFSSEHSKALEVCRLVKLQTPACELPESPREIVVLCLESLKK